MLAEDVYQRLRSQAYLPVTLEDVNNTPQLCLEGIDNLLQQVSKLKHEASDRVADHKEKVEHLTASIRRLTDHNALLHTRLLACLDTLDATKQEKLEDEHTDEAKAELDAMKLLNQNLVARLLEANRQNADLRESLTRQQSTSNMVNAPATIQRAVVASIDYETDEDDLSDAATEVQHNAPALSAHLKSKQSSTPSQSRPASLRTRTVLYEMMNELQSTRHDIVMVQADHQRQVTLLQSQIDSRNRELTNMYNQLNLFCGLPGLSLAKSLEQKSTSSASSDHLSTTLDDLEVISSLRAQLQQLRQDVTRLTIEKDNIARYANEVPTMAIPYATEGANGSPANENNFLRRAPEPHWQQIEYEAVAKRASERLLEQSRHIEGLERELYGLRMSGCLPAQGQEYGAPSKNSPLAPDRQKDHQHASGAAIPRPHSVPLIDVRTGQASSSGTRGLGGPWNASS